MRILLDTNIVLDKLAAREPFKGDADRIFNLIGNNELTGYITVAGVTDIYYILRKKLSDIDCRNALRRLFDVLNILTVTRDDCEAALELPLEDFEHALIMASAEKVNVDFIITRDEVFLKAPRTMSPSNFLIMWEKS